ncbi:MAG: hypothetical protein LC121_16100 [Anaerolineae bacterium]|nr:hypothetical protein [Anaerolineae bacterium]
MNPIVLYVAAGILAVLAIPFALAGVRWLRGKLRSMTEQRESLASLAQAEALQRASRRLQQLEQSRAAAARSAPAKLAALKQAVRP